MSPPVCVADTVRQASGDWAGFEFSDGGLRQLSVNLTVTCGTLEVKSHPLTGLICPLPSPFLSPASQEPHFPGGVPGSVAGGHANGVFPGGTHPGLSGALGGMGSPGGVLLLSCPEGSPATNSLSVTPCGRAPQQRGGQTKPLTWAPWPRAQETDIDVLICSLLLGVGEKLTCTGAGG